MNKPTPNTQHQTPDEPSATDSVKTEQVALPVPRKVKGTLTILSDDDMQFKAQRSTGISSQQEIATAAGGSKIYRTVGERQQKTIAHIVVPPGTPDAAAYIYGKVDELTKDMQTKAKPRLRGTTLKSDPDLRITLSKKEHRLEVTMNIDLSQKPNYQQELMNLMYRTNQCFAINVTSINLARK